MYVHFPFCVIVLLLFVFEAKLMNYILQLAKICYITINDLYITSFNNEQYSLLNGYTIK